MDPLTHVLAGATLAWVATGKHLGRKSLVIGAAAALLPDVDVLIRSAADPLLAIEHHRGFTHSLSFVPVGGAVAGVLAYLSHVLLDAATTYGTRLFWPFSRLRVGLDVISIIDPLFTAIVLAGVIAAFAARRRVAVMALAVAVGWLALGFVQRERAGAVQARLAAVRGHRLERGAVFPTVGNTIVWRSLYRTNGMLHIDRIRVPWLGGAAVAGVTAVPLVSGSGRDFDARYSLRADRYEPVWGIRVAPTEWVNRSRQREVSFAPLWAEIRGRDPAFRPLP